jgi:hypothetical protein
MFAYAFHRDTSWTSAPRGGIHLDDDLPMETYQRDRRHLPEAI